MRNIFFVIATTFILSSHAKAQFTGENIIFARTSLAQGISVNIQAAPVEVINETIPFQSSIWPIYDIEFTDSQLIMTFKQNGTFITDPLIVVEFDFPVLASLDMSSTLNTTINTLNNRIAFDLSGSYSSSDVITINLSLPPNNPVPTMGEWSLIILGQILSIFGIVAIKQKSIVFA